MHKTIQEENLKIKYVTHLPDLIKPEDYSESERKKIRVQIRTTDEGIEILGDSMYPQLLEKLLGEAGAEEILGVLCG